MPFIQRKFAYFEHKFMQNNDPKHTSCAKAFFEEKRAPAESPDLNTIENELKVKVKPRNVDELKDGFWKTVTPAISQTPESGYGRLGSSTRCTVEGDPHIQEGVH
jgi:hypothetical protein